MTALTDAPRPLDDLTRDLRARQAIPYFALAQSMLIVAPFNFGGTTGGSKPDPLSLEAADAIDRLRAELNAANTTIADAKIDHLMRPAEEPKPLEHDAYASLAPLTAEDGVRRWRRRIDLDGGKYSIFLAEVLPPDFDLPREPKHLPAAFLRNSEYFYDGGVDALAEALWERAYVPPTVPDVVRPGPTEWTVATAFEQLEKCRYACEGGPLENNVAYRWLKRDLAAKTVKSALDGLRPILLDHRLETFFLASKDAARVCRCGSSFSDSSGWVDHILSLLAFGSEPTADAKAEDGIVRRAPVENESDPTPFPGHDLVGLGSDGPLTCAACCLVGAALSNPCPALGRPSSAEILSAAWRSVPLTSGLLFDALGRAEHLPFSKDAALDALSCEVERAARAVVRGES